MTVYKFEKVSPAYGSDAEVATDVDVFRARLGIAQTTPLKESDRELIRAYVTANHRAAHWYDRKGAKRREEDVR